MKKPAVVLPAILLAALVSLIPASPAFGDEDLDSNLVATLAAKADISEERARRLVLIQDDFSRLTQGLARSDLQFAGAAIDPGPSGEAWISFAGQPGPEAVDRIKASGIDIQIRTARFTAAELKTALREAHASLESRPGIGGAAGFLDARSQKLVFVVWPETSGASKEAEGVVDEFLAAKSGGPEFDISVSSRPAAVDEVNGGLHLSNGCTSAFNVKYSGGKGILTAAHCSNSPSGFPFVREREEAGVDAQLHRATAVTNRIRYTSSGSTRAITTWGYPPTGGALCVYGAASGNKCTTIFTNDACWPGLGCGFYATSDGVTTGGDSGGPWYSGSTAYGVHKGTMWLWGNKSVFSDMGFVTSKLNVTLCTAANC